MSPSISRQQLGNRKRGTRMKRNFLADEEELTKKKKKKKEKEPKEKNSFPARISYISLPIKSQVSPAAQSTKIRFKFKIL